MTRRTLPVKRKRQRLPAGLRTQFFLPYVVGPAAAALAASLRANRATSDRDVTQLTPRERDILKLIAQGLPNKMIARRLDITESTVKVHVKHMLKKMKLKSRVEAAVWVHQERIF